MKVYWKVESNTTVPTAMAFPSGHQTYRTRALGTGLLD